MKVLIAVLLYLPITAWATTQQYTPAQIQSMALGAYKSPTPADASDSMINVQVPESSLTFRSDRHLLQAHHDTIEFETSNWVPKGYANPSYATDTTDYNTASVPQMSFNILTDGANIGPVRLRPKLGFSFGQFQRAGILPVNQNNVAVTENLNFYSARAGLELSTQNSFYRLKPIASVSLLPSWEQAPTSTFSDGISKTPLLYEGTLGLSLRVLAMPTYGVQSLSVETGVEHAQAFNDNTLAATAMYAGLRGTL